MRSFAEYRKTCLKESLNKFSARGSSSALFDILKLDLLEVHALPELLSENVVAKIEFNKFRQEYSENYRYVVEAICEHGKYRFYDVLLQEVDATAATAIDPAAAFRMLRDEVRAKLSEMLKSLKVALGQGVSPQGQANTNAPANTGAPAAQPTATTQTAQQPAQSPAAPAQGGQQQGFFNKLRPSDGWLAGLGRVIGRPFRDIGRYIKKNWYDENALVIEMMLSEQQGSIDAIFDKFEKEFLQWFDQRSAEIAKDAGIDLQAAGVSNPTVSQPAMPEPDPNAMNDKMFTAVKNAVEQAPNVKPEELMRPPFSIKSVAKAQALIDAAKALIAKEKAAQTQPGQPEDFQPVGTKSEKEVQGVDPDVVTGDSNLQQQAAQGDPQAQEQVHQHYENLMAGLQAIGLGSTLKRNWGRFRGEMLENPSLKKPGSVLTVDNKPISELEVPVYRHGREVIDPTTGKPAVRKIGSSATELLREIVKRIYVNVFNQDPDNPNLKSGRFPEAVFNYISNQLGGFAGSLKGGSKNDLILELLLKVGARKTGSVNKTPSPQTPTPAASPSAPTTTPAVPGQPQTAASPAAQAPATPETPQGESPTIAKLKQSGDWAKVSEYLRSVDPEAYKDDASMEAAIKDAESQVDPSQLDKFYSSLLQSIDGTEAEAAPEEPQAAPVDAPTASPMSQKPDAVEEPTLDKNQLGEVGKLADIMVNILSKDPTMRRLGDHDSLKQIAVDLIGKENFNSKDPNDLKRVMAKVQSHIKSLAEQTPKDMESPAEAAPEAPAEVVEAGKEYHSFLTSLKDVSAQHGVNSSQVTRMLEDMYEKLQSQLVGDPQAAMDKTAERAEQYETELAEDRSAPYKFIQEIKDLFKEIHRKNKAAQFSGDVSTPVAKPQGSSGGLGSFMNKVRPKTTDESVRAMVDKFKQRINESTFIESSASALRKRLGV